MANVADVPIPDWVDCEAEEIRGLDLLGLRLTAQGIGNALLSGITTVSPTIRYLSIRAWIIREFELSGLPATPEALEGFAVPIESAVVLGNLLVDSRMPGLVGSDKAHPLANAEGDPLPLGRLVSQIAFGIYTGPSEALGLSSTLPSGLPALTTERGKPLADEVERSVDGIQFKELLKEGPLPKALSRNVLRELGECLRVDKIPASERDLLIEALMPQSPRMIAGNDERMRVSTYVLLLELAERLGREPKEGDLFQVASDPEPELSPTLHGVLTGWAAYAIRDLIAVVHEAALNAVVTELAALNADAAFADAPGLIRQMLGRVQEINDPLRELRLLGENESYEELSVRTLESRVEAATEPSQTRDGIRRWNKPVNEASVRRLAQSGGAGSLGLLPVAWMIASRRVDTSTEAGAKIVETLSRRGWSRIGLEQVVLPFLREWRQRDVVLPEVVFQLVRRTVEQHLRIAWSRLVTDPKRDVALMIADGNRWYFRKTFRHGRLASRLREAVGWLRQLGLVTKDGITEPGRATLRRGHDILADSGPGGVS